MNFKSNQFYKIAYYICWALFGAGVLLLPVSIIWEYQIWNMLYDFAKYGSGSLPRLDADEGWIGLLSIFIGGAAGVWIAKKTRSWQGLHRKLIWSGGIGSTCFFIISIVMFILAKTAPRGFLSGLGETLAGLLALWIAMIFLFALGAGIFGRLNSGGESA